MHKFARDLLCGALAALPMVAAAEGPTLSDVFSASGVSVSGAIDASFDWDDVDGAPGARQFETSTEGFSLHQVNVSVSKAFTDGIGATVNVVLGDDANVISGGGSDDFDLTQAFISYTSGPITVIGGRFTTLAGYEVILPSANVNATRSLLFFNQPLVHTGVRGTVKAGDAFAFTLGLNNAGFGVGKVDNNTETTVEAQFAVTPSKAFALYLTGYTGDEDAQPGAGKIRADYVDLVTTLALGDMVSLALNADYQAVEDGSGGHVGFVGAAGYVNLQATSKLRFSLRGEYLDFDTGVAGADSNWIREVTFTTGFKVTDALELVGEVRHDTVDDGAFSLPAHDVTLGIPNNDQTTATIHGIYKF